MDWQMIHYTYKYKVRVDEQWENWLHTASSSLEEKEMTTVNLELTL